jgi:hypothetical protein
MGSLLVEKFISFFGIQLLITFAVQTLISVESHMNSIRVFVYPICLSFIIKLFSYLHLGLPSTSFLYILQPNLCIYF